MKFYKNYNEWNKLKEILNSVDISIPFKEGEIWIVPLTSIEKLLSGVHVQLFSSKLETNSAAVITQLQTISSNRLMNRIGIIDNI